MQINPILYQYQADKFPDIAKDYISVKNAVDKKDNSKASPVFEAVPVYGRINTLPEKLEQKDYAPVMGIVSLAILNGPEEISDVFSVYNQIRKGFPKPVTFHSGYDNKKAQHPFSFFRGTILHEYMNPLSPKCPHPKLAAMLIRQDKTLWDTKIGEWFKKKFEIETDKTKTNIEDIDFTTENKSYVPAKVFKAKNPFADITARALTRTSTLGALALGGIEAAHVAHEVSNGKNFFEKAGKSAATLGVTLGATGVLGAIGAKYLGPTGSLAGMGLGAIAGSAVSNAID